MRHARHSAGSSVAPLLIRLALGLTFIWAGTGKLLTKTPYPPEQLAMLANMGVDAARRAALPATAPRTTPPTTPAEPLPEPEATPAAPDTSAMRAPSASFRVILAQDIAPREGEEEHPLPPAGEPDPTPDDAPATTGSAGTHTYTPADFDRPLELRRLFGIALLLKGAEGERWPRVLTRENLPVIQAQLLSWTELLGGVFILLGMLTRLTSLALATAMAVALWLVEIGPAVFADADASTTLGFLPPVNNFDPGAWMHFLWVSLLFCTLLSLVFSGPGAVSLDRWIFGGRSNTRRHHATHARHEDDDDE